MNKMYVYLYYNFLKCNNVFRVEAGRLMVKGKSKLSSPQMLNKFHYCSLASDFDSLLIKYTIDRSDNANGL